MAFIEIGPNNQSHERCTRGAAFAFILMTVHFGLALHAEVIDRIVAVVNGTIITASDVRMERLLAPVFGESPQDDPTAREDLIERALVEEQISQFPDIEVTDSEIDEAVRKLSIPADIDTAQVRSAMRRRILRAKYFDVRFRQFIRIGDDEIQKYYTDVFLPEARTRGLNPVPTLEQASEPIRNNIIDERMSQEVQAWLETIRKRSDIEVFK